MARVDITHLDLRIEVLLTGKPRPLAPNVTSAIAKTPVDGLVRVGWLGLEGDGVADPVHHGGHDKAIHIYCRDHYAWWQSLFGDHPLLAAPGAFGENLSVRGALDGDFCLGDRFSLGTAVVEVSQGRQPCVKLNHRFGRSDVLPQVIRSGRAGFYFRVIRPGEAQAGGRLTLLERPLPEWPIPRVFALLVGGGHKKDRAATAALAAMPVLADVWRRRAAALAR